MLCNLGAKVLKNAFGQIFLVKLYKIRYNFAVNNVFL